MFLMQRLLKRMAPAAIPIAAADAAMAATRDPYSTDASQLAILVGGLLVGIVGLYAVAAAVTWTMGFFQHRRSCKIPAALETEDETFDGHITVIGLTGCRFQPLNKTTEGRLLQCLGGPKFHDFDVRIANQPHPVFVDGFYMGYAPLYFYDNIHRDDVSEMLHLSKVVPDLAPRIGRPTTGKTHRDEIARRREAIRRLKSRANHA